MSEKNWEEMKERERRRAEAHYASSLREAEAEVAALRAEVARLREEDRTNTDRMVELALAKDRAVAARDALAERVETAEAMLGALRKSAHELVSAIQAHECESFDCDRTDERYCDCLKNATDAMASVLARCDGMAKEEG